MKFFHRHFFPTTTAGRLVACFLMGAAGAGGMAPLYLWPMLLIALSSFWILLSDLSSQEKWKSFLAGWLFGFGYFVHSLYWIGNALLIEGNPFLWAYPLAICGLPALLAIFPAAASLLACTIKSGKSFPAFIIFLLCMILSEYARGHLFTGFPWNLYGMSWTGNLAMLQFLSIGGIYSLSFLTIFLFTTPGFTLKGSSSKRVRYTTLICAIITGISLYIFGTNRLSQNPTVLRDDLIIDIIQPNITQADKWDGNKMWDNYRESINLIRADAVLSSSNKNAIRLLILPETAVTYHHLQNHEAMAALHGALLHFREPTYVLTGALLKDQNGYHNSLIALNQETKQVYGFDKFHLVPFGEYMPFQKYIPFGPIVNFSGFVEGKGAETAIIGDIPPFSPLVCYEIIFPGAVTNKTSRRPEWIVNVTNDAWYGISAGPFQHMAHAIYRSIEEGIPVVRSANTGISVITDSYGRIISLTPLMSTYREESFLPSPARQPTLYSSLRFF